MIKSSLITTHLQMFSCFVLFFRYCLVLISQIDLVKLSRFKVDIKHNVTILKKFDIVTKIKET